MLTAPAPQALTTPAVFRRALEAQPDKAFLRWADGCVTYAQMDTRTRRIAGGLEAAGLARFGKVALMLRNRVEFVEAMLAAARMGAVYVPINVDYKGAVLAHQLSRADVTHMVVEAEFLPRLAEVGARLDALTHVFVVGEPRETAPPPRAGCTVAPYAGLHGAAPLDADAPVEACDPLAISFTSGTTGLSKGVLATHAHVLAFAQDWIAATGCGPDDRLYTCLPMFHAIATWLGVIPAMIQQTTLAFSERFSASRFWDDVRRHDATVVHGVFAMIPLLLKQPERADDAQVPARVFYIGQRNAAFERRFGCRIVEVYGATETGVVTFTPPGEEGRPGSCGLPNARSYAVEVVDDEDRPVAPGEVGEIVVRPARPFTMFHEYYNMPHETLEAFRNLWFHTGDSARRDADGWLYFVDRKKDAIRRRGENISSFEVESVLNADPRILECAAVAEPSELGEDDVKVVIVPQPGVDLSAAAVWALCDAQMPRFWAPRYIEFREALPKTPNGKIQKFLLRSGEGAGAVHDRQAEVA